MQTIPSQSVLRGHYNIKKLEFVNEFSLEDLSNQAHLDSDKYHQIQKECYFNSVLTIQNFHI